MRRLFAAIVMVLLSVAVASAQNYMVIDSERVFKSIESYNDALNKIESLSKQYQLNVDDKFKEVETLYREIGVHFRSLSPWQVYVITSHPGFEKFYGKRADKVRKLYNGMIPCYLYQFFKNK